MGSLAGIYLAAGPDFYFDFAGNKTIEGMRTDKKKAEVGINVGAGLKLLNHLQVGANYNIPLGNTADIEDLASICGLYFLSSLSLYIVYEKEFPITGNSFLFGIVLLRSRIYFFQFSYEVELSF